MPEFEYSATDEQGQPVRGRITADNRQEAVELLGQTGLRDAQVIEIVKAKISASEADSVAAKISSIAAAGMPLAPALHAVAEQLDANRRQRPLARAVRVLATRLESGEALDSALAKTSSQFPTPWQGVIAAGIRSGQLHQIMAWLVERQQARRQIRRQLFLAIGYPLSLLAIVLCLSFFLSVFIIPSYMELLTDFGTEMPAITKFMIAAMPLFWQLPIALAVGAILVFAVTALFGGRRAAHRLLHFIPLIGRIYFFHSLAGFSQMLALLLRQAIPLPEALRISSQTIRDRAIGEACHRAAGDVEAGKALAIAMAEQYVLLRSLAPVISWGETNGTVVSVLEYIAESCEGWSRFHTDFLRTVVPPFVFLFVLWAVGMTVSALLWPILVLVSALT